MEISFDAKELERFKKRARSKDPMEYLEVLFGRKSRTAVEIVSIVPIKHLATLNSDGGADCNYEYSALEPLKQIAATNDLEWLGTIHSHPGYRHTRPSESDNESALYNEEKVFGIYAFAKSPGGRCTYSKVSFFFPQHAIAQTT